MRTALVLSFVLCLVGCSLTPTASPTPESGVRMQGSVYGGQQPIAGAHVYLFAANTAGYGQPSVSLLDPTASGVATDSVGAYVTTDANGVFTITGDYTCTSGTQVYLYALGGDPGAGINSAAGLLAVLGQCPVSGSFALSLPFIQVNEVTTIAAAYAMAGFATDATHVSNSGTPQALVGISNAFANAANLADISTGASLTVTPAGNGVVPNTLINKLANILAACINTTGPSSTGCTTLFANTLSGGTTGTAPTDTATAAINIAHNPGANVSTLSALPSPAAPFAPTTGLGGTNDFSIAINFTGTTISQPMSAAVDASGNIWTVNNASSTVVVTKMSPLGAILSGTTGYVIGSDAVLPSGQLAIDQNGSAWVTGTNHIYKVSSSGTVSTFQPDEGSAYTSIAIDATGNAWSNATSGTPSLIELSPAGSDLHFSSTAPIGVFAGLAISNSGIVWTNGNPNSLFGTSISSGTNVNVTESQLAGPSGIALDSFGNPWVASTGSYLGQFYTLTQFGYNNTTATYAPVSAVPADLRPSGVAIDGSNTAWLAARYFQGALAAYANTGSGLTQYAYHLYAPPLVSWFPTSIALDPSGNAWLTSAQGVVEFVGVATPVVTPISVGVKNNTLATRP